MIVDNSLKKGFVSSDVELCHLQLLSNSDEELSEIPSEELRSPLTCQQQFLNVIQKCHWFTLVRLLLPSVTWSDANTLPPVRWKDVLSLRNLHKTGKTWWPLASLVRRRQRGLVSTPQVSQQMTHKPYSILPDDWMNCSFPAKIGWFDPLFHQALLCLSSAEPQITADKPISVQLQKEKSFMSWMQNINSNPLYLNI